VQDNSQLSPKTQEIIDTEVRSLVTKQYERAQALLREHRGALESLAKELLEHETLDGSAVQESLQKEKPAGA
jgi:cell division protease FtsH